MFDFIEFVAAAMSQITKFACHKKLRGVERGTKLREHTCGCALWEIMGRTGVVVHAALLSFGDYANGPFNGLLFLVFLESFLSPHNSPIKRQYSRCAAKCSFTCKRKGYIEEKHLCK